jgi:hypothetical protein
MNKFLWFGKRWVASLPWIATAILPAIAADLPATNPAVDPPAKTFQPGFWQPIARVNPAIPIQISVVNESGLPLEFGLSEQRGFSQVQAGETGRVYTKPLPMHLLIYPAKESRANVQFKVTVSGDNQASIAVVRAPDGSNGDLSVSIDQYGALYIN